MSVERLTVDDIKKLPDEFLTPEQVSGVIGCMPYSLNLQAKEDITKLGFPACLIGTRLRVPRKAFIRWMEVGNAPSME